MTPFEKAVVALTAVFAVVLLSVNVINAPKPYDLAYQTVAQEPSKPSGELVYNGQIVRMVNPNTADLGELTILPGIGEALASRIVEYRNKNGFFERPEDLLEVNGIGPSKLEKMRKYIKFD